MHHVFGIKMRYFKTHSNVNNVPFTVYTACQCNLFVPDFIFALGKIKIKKCDFKYAPCFRCYIAKTRLLQDSLLPANERCRDQTKKKSTGPLNRKKLIEYLINYAKNEEDWPENKPYQAGVIRGLYQFYSYYIADLRHQLWYQGIGTICL